MPRSIASPALIAEYQTQLPDKKLLQAKLHEFYLQNAVEGEDQYSVLICPDDRILPKLLSDTPGACEINPKSEITWFPNPCLGRIDPDSGDHVTGPTTQLFRQGGIRYFVLI
jgi:hypothetical protein